MTIFLSVAALIYMIMLSIIFFKKKKVRTNEIKLYSILIIVTIVSVCVELFIPVIIEYNIPNLLNIIMKLFLVCSLIWTMFFTLYVYSLSHAEKIKKKVMFIIYAILNLIIVIIIFTLPIYLYRDSTKTYSLGPAVDFLFYVSLVYTLLIIFMCLLDIKNIRKKQYLPVIILIILLSASAIIQKNYPEILMINFVYSLTIFLMFHTIENPDVKMLAQLELARDQAEKANNAKTEFLSNMSHEIRTPLNAIVGFSECISNSDDIVSARSDARDIIMASQNLLEIVNGILDISKIEANKMEIIETDYELEPILKNLSKLMIPRIGEKPIEFKSNFAMDLPTVLHGDSGKLKQIITNILTNAVKYTEEGRIDFTVNCINEKDTCSLVISVEDTGRGIKSEKINTLFNKFERLDEDRNTTTEGTGLGLAITKKLTEMMGGKIIVQSKYGIGSKFTVYIKQKIVSMEKTKKEPIEVIETINLSGKKILVVDDNKMNLKIASRILKTYNVSVYESESGIECIERIKANEKYDLILLDDMMPRLTGTETLKKLKEMPNFNIPVIALTANALEGMREKYLQEGFDDYLSKPFNKLELEMILKKYINTKVKNDNIPVPIKNIEIPQKQEKQKEFNNKKILIVDDNKLNIKVAEMMLKKYNTQIESVLSGVECLDKIKTNNYDLIFMDYMMPEMDGLQTLHKLKEIETFKTPVVLLTADAIEGSKEKFLKGGFDEYISKPIDKVELDRIILKYLDD